MAPDGAINMVACSRDETIGPHNMYWQFTAGGAIEHGSPPTLKYGWNAVTGAQPAGTGTYQISVNAFDGSGGVTPMVIYACVMSPTLASRIVTFGVISATNIWFGVRTDAGVLTDLAAGEQLHVIVTGRRLKQTAAVTYGTFQALDYNMGLAGL